MKLLKTSNKQKILKASREKKKMYIQRNKNERTKKLLFRNIVSQRPWINLFTVLEGRYGKKEKKGETKNLLFCT